MYKYFKYSVMALLIGCALPVAAQDVAEKATVVKKGSQRFLRSTGFEYPLDERTITVKLKHGRTMGNVVGKVLRENKLGYVDIEIPQNVDIEEAYKKMVDSDLFESVEYNSFGEFFSYHPNDEYRSWQWWVDRINLPFAWSISTGSSSVKVAVLDTGVDTSHPDLGYGNDSYSNIDFTHGDHLPQSQIYAHGTYVAGIISAKTNNHIGISGTAGGNGAEGVKIIPYMVSQVRNNEDIGEMPNVQSSIVDDKIIAAVDAGANVINMSLGASNQSAIRSALNYAYANGVVVVCATGTDLTREGGHAQSNIAFPASYSTTIAVGAINEQGYRDSRSYYGMGIDLCAPGRLIDTTEPFIGVAPPYRRVEAGTSLSAPQVSGIIALMLSINPSLSPDAVRSILRNSANKSLLPAYTFNSDGWNNEVGYGIVDAAKAVARVAFKINGPELICDSAAYEITNLPADATVTWSLGDNYYNDSPELFRTNNHTCMIKRDASVQLNGNLVAHVYDDTNRLLCTLYKDVMTREIEHFSYSVVPTQPIYEYVAEDHPARARDGSVVTINSPKFVGMDITSNSSEFTHTGSTVQFKVNGYTYIHVNNPNNCESYSLKFNVTERPFNPVDPVLPPFVLSNGSGINIGFNSTDNNDEMSTRVESFSVAVYDQQTGARVYTSTVMGNHTVIPTSNLKKGIYIIQINAEGSVFTQKIKI